VARGRARISGRGRWQAAVRAGRLQAGAADFNFFAADGCGLWFGGAARGHNPGGRFLSGCHACWFCFHNRNSLFLALNALPGEKLRREFAGRNVNFPAGCG